MAKSYKKPVQPQPVQPQPAQTTAATLAAKPMGAALNYSAIIYSLLLFFAFVIAYQYIFDSKIHLGGDNAEYYILAKALAAGKGYTYIANTSAAAHNHFPPGYPFILSILMRCFSDEQSTLTAFNGAFLLGSLFLLFNLFKRATDNIHLAFAVCIACLFNFHIAFKFCV